MKKTDATTQHCFHTSIFCHQKKLSFFHIQESYLVQRCHTYLEAHLFNFEKKKMKKAEFPLYTGSFHHATMPHICWNAPIKFWAKRWKILTQPRNTYFRTHNKFFNEVEKNWKSWHNNATLFFIAYIDFLKK